MDVASLSLEVKTDSLKNAVVTLKELPAAASAAERAAAKWGTATDAAGRSSEEFSRRVRKTIADLSFETEQLKRSAAERQRYAILRRAGVAEASAEGQAILASVQALQAQRAALGNVSVGARAAGAAAGVATSAFRTMAATLGPIAIALAVIQSLKQAFEFASGLDEAAEQIGVTAKNLQALQFAAVQSGVKMEQLDTGLSKFSQKMGEAAEGSKEVIEALNLLGVKNLDVAGKLRPTEDLLVDVAKAITSIDDPARRSAAAVDFFGKAGTRMLPVLSEIAGGMDALGQKASEAGAVIEAVTIQRLDNLSDAIARLAQTITARLATTMGNLIAIAEALGKVFLDLANQAGVGITKLVDAIEVGGAQASAMFIEAFRAMPEALGQLFTNAWESARVATAKGINALTSLLPDWMGLGGGTTLDTTPRGTGPVGAGMGARISAAGEAAAAEALQRQAIARQAAMQSDEDRARAGKLGVVGGASTTGARTSAAKDAGKEAEKAAESYRKLIQGSEQFIATQKQEAEALGLTAIEAAKLKYEQELLNKAANDNLKLTPAQTEEIKKQAAAMADAATATARLTSVKDATKGAQEFIEQQKLTQAAMGLSAEAAARLRFEKELLNKASKDGTIILKDEEIAALKASAEEMAKVEEQTKSMADAFSFVKDIFSDLFSDLKDALIQGKNLWQSFGDAALGVLSKVADKLLNMALDGLLGSFFAAPSSAAAASTGGTNAAGSIAGVAGKLGGGSGGGGFFSGIGDSLNTAWNQTKSFFGFGPIAGQGLGGIGGSGIGLGGILGAAGGVAGGIMGLSKGGTAGTIGGIASLIGGGVSLIPGIGQIAGPAIALLGSLLPSLFGQTKPTITNQAYGQVSYGAGGFGTSGGAWGPSADSSALTGPLGQVGASMDAIFKAFGGVKDAGKVWGVALQSFSQQYGDDSTFSNQTSFLVGPGGQQRQWGQGSTEGDVGMGAAGVAATLNSILGGAVGDISDNMRKALEGVNLSGKDTFETLGTVVTEIMAFDEAIKGFGKTTTEAESAIQAVDDSFTSLYATAEKYSLDIVKLDQERDRQRLKATEDFSRGITQDLLGFTNPLQAQLNDLDKQREESLANNADFVRLVTGYNDQAANIEQLYYLRRNEVIDQANAAALAAQQQASNAIVSAATASLGQLQGLIAQLSPGGALSNLDPAGQLAGLRATYSAAYAQAQADPSNADAISRTVAAGQSLAQFSQSYYGGSSAYSRERDMILGQAQSLQVGVATSAMNRVSDTQAHSYLSQIVNNTSGLSERMAQIETLIGLLTRYVANQAA